MAGVGVLRTCGFEVMRFQSKAVMASVMAAFVGRSAINDGLTGEWEDVDDRLCVMRQRLLSHGCDD